MEDTPFPSLHPLKGDACADVCIVGAGIAGLTTAYYLLREGRSVIVLDDGPVGGGESGRTTAHISNVLDQRYSWLEKVHGEEGIKKLAESHTCAIDEIKKNVRGEGIRCEFERLDGYFFLADGDPTETLTKELEAAHRAGLIDVKFLDHGAIGRSDGGPALCFPRQATFHILQYLHGLTRAIEKQGGKIFTGTHASKIEGGAPCRTETSDGYIVTSEDIVIATNAPVKDNVQIFSRQAAYRTYVVAGSIPKGSVERALYWDTSTPYHYVRLQERPWGDLLIIGGEDEKTGQHDDADLRFGNLELWARDQFPVMGEISFRWSGQVMESVGGLAFIGLNPADPNHVYIATGDSGSGMTHGTIAGILLTDLILGRENQWANLYDPSRIRFRALGKFAEENANVAKVLVAGRLRNDPDSKETLARECGAVIREGVKKIALYRDAEGSLREFSAVCPHKGCIVQWNSYEKSFDCPCHGSRFDIDGKVLNGPAIRELSRISS